MIVPEAEQPFLELYADELLRFHKRQSGDTTVGAWHGILSPEQLQLRQYRELVVDPDTFSFGRPGLYRRAYNPLMGKRPKKYQPGDNNLEFDRRLPGDPPTPLGFTGAQWARSVAFGTTSGQGEYHHLSSGQRSAIRRVLRQVASRPDAVQAARQVLAEKYGVPPWVIIRVAKASSVCHN